MGALLDGPWTLHPHAGAPLPAAVLRDGQRDGPILVCLELVPGAQGGDDGPLRASLHHRVPDHHLAALAADAARQLRALFPDRPIELRLA